MSGSERVHSMLSGYGQRLQQPSPLTIPSGNSTSDMTTSGSFTFVTQRDVLTNGLNRANGPRKHVGFSIEPPPYNQLSDPLHRLSQENLNRQETEDSDENNEWFVLTI